MSKKTPIIDPDAPIIYKSNQFVINHPFPYKFAQNGLECDIKFENNLFLTWKFNWDSHKQLGIDEIQGTITIKQDQQVVASFNITLVESPQKVVQGALWHGTYFTVGISLVPIRNSPPTDLYDVMFLPSEKNDSILIVDKKRLHVNRAFLSYHSDFFRALFSSNFREGQQTEIEIKEVSFEDMGLLLSTIYPKTEFPTDRTAKKLLELGDRFMMSSVVHHVEYHLLHNSRINSELMIWMADRYEMTKLFDKCIRELNSAEKAKKLKQSPEYQELSDGAKSRILDKVMTLI